MNKVIILGTAHGKNVAGKCSPDGSFKEYIFSREVCKELKDELEKEGYKVLIDIADDIVPGKQSAELRKRVEIVNSACTKYGTDNCMYIAIHADASGNGSKWMNARGWSVYTSIGRTRSDELATCLWCAANQILPHDNKTALRADRSDGDVDFESNLYVLKKTKCVAVLTENLFMDNEMDCRYLSSEEGHRAIVELHKTGIMNFLSLGTLYRKGEVL